MTSFASANVVKRRSRQSLLVGAAEVALTCLRADCYNSLRLAVGVNDITCGSWNSKTASRGPSRTDGSPPELNHDFPCSTPFATDPSSPYTFDEWKQKVYHYLKAKNEPSMDVTLTRFWQRYQNETRHDVLECPSLTEAVKRMVAFQNEGKVHCFKGNRRVCILSFFLKLCVTAMYDYAENVKQTVDAAVKDTRSLSEILQTMLEPLHEEQRLSSRERDGIAQGRVEKWLSKHAPNKTYASQKW